MHRSTDEIAEIERHKYFLSEKRGHDVGWEFAEQDWECHHAEQWRRDHGGSAAAHCESNGAATAVCCQGATATGTDGGSTPQESEVHQTTIRKDSAERGGLRWLLSRLFQQQTSQ